ncbi:DUF2509 family protein [Candidatus Pantoea soli]|uniref:DUF2509 family protein n=1 Tax=Candidatus Pantoea soli TaxID=3098669 RepID=A0A518XF89_9GAMM|nr:DUF2509 family protein [Pantoea soli]QDY42883.1 DUF2509 family protein [Pantoea soli]
MNQQGNSALGMVLMVLLVGSVTLNATRTQLGQGMPLLADVRQQQQDYWQAQAALQWGLQQNWSPGEGWRCQTEMQQQWQSCLLRQEEDHGLLSARHAGRALWLFHWISLRNAGVQAQAHGWIDYCPLPEEALCPPQDAAGL